MEKMMNQNEMVRRLNRINTRTNRYLNPPEDLTVTQWADKYMVLSSEDSAEPGPYRSSKTPYVREIMDSINDDRVHKISVMASSQIGKTVLERNILGYFIHQDPCPILMAFPTEPEAIKYSVKRLSPMFRDCKCFKGIMADAKGRDAKNTQLQKSFAGGDVVLTGTQTPAPLSSVPVRVGILDEIDRFPRSAGTEGDPIKLIEARMITFYNRKLIAVSTPTVKGKSRIEKLYSEGTMEVYESQCPDCHEYSEIVFGDISFSHETEWIAGDVHYTVDNIFWTCPQCGSMHTERVMKKAPTRWHAKNPSALKRGHRSFRLRCFISPWVSWKDVILEFLDAKDDPERLKAVLNTKFGEVWEPPTQYSSNETDLLKRKEDYGKNADGTPVEVPDQVAYLTMAVDTQDNRFEYEVLGHGVAGETWGIRKGLIYGRPDDPDTQQRLLDTIRQPRYFKDKSSYLLPRVTFIDSGGHFTQAVYEFCRRNRSFGVFPIKGKGGASTVFTSPPSKVPVGESKNFSVSLFTIGVDQGKALVMNNIEVEEAGPNFCHFPVNPEAGYDRNYFMGLLSESYEYDEKKQGWYWKKKPGRERNEPLDLRNYNLAAAKCLGVNAQAELDRRNNVQPAKPKKKKKIKPKRFDPWS